MLGRSRGLYLRDLHLIWEFWSVCTNLSKFDCDVSFVVYKVSLYAIPKPTGTKLPAQRNKGKLIEHYQEIFVVGPSDDLKLCILYKVFIFEKQLLCERKFEAKTVI